MRFLMVLDNEQVRNERKPMNGFLVFVAVLVAVAVAVTAVQGVINLVTYRFVAIPLNIAHRLEAGEKNIRQLEEQKRLLQKPRAWLAYGVWNFGNLKKIDEIIHDIRNRDPVALF